MARHSFQPRNSLFPCFSLYFPTLRALFREISPFIFPALLFLHSVKAFPIRVFPFVTPSSTFISRSTPLPSLIPPLTFTPPPLSLTFLPTFPPLSPINNAIRAPSRLTRVRVRSRTYPRVRRFSFFSFTASPTFRNPLYISILGVKENKKKPSQKTQSSHNQHINTKHPISSAVNFI